MKEKQKEEAALTARPASRFRDTTLKAYLDTHQVTTGSGNGPFLLDCVLLVEEEVPVEGLGHVGIQPESALECIFRAHFAFSA
ncbi:MAG: hypothetical protein HQL50_03545 [Magnetococcales bacterium]|nr:hypothetical protein [Magnetococcales bacterium]